MQSGLTNIFGHNVMDQWGRRVRKKNEWLRALPGKAG